MRILLTISDFRGGGAEREFSILLKQLDRNRFQPHVCLWRSIFDYPEPTDIDYTILGKYRARDTPRTILRMARLIDQQQPEVIFSQLHYVNMVVGTALALSRWKPAWVCRQVNDPRREMPWPMVYWARWALRRADCVAGCSDGVTEATSEWLRLDRARVQTLRNVVDVDRIESLSRRPLPIERRENTFTIVHAGRLSTQKGQHMLLDALGMLKNPHFELWMLGEGPLLEELRNHASRLAIADRIRWLGFQENPYPFFRAADCFVLSSLHEGSPNTLIEAMLCGTVAVSTSCSYGPSELIEDGVTGRLTRVGAADDLANTISEIMDDPDRARQLATAGCDRMRHEFDTLKVSETYMELFERVAREHVA